MLMIGIPGVAIPAAAVIDEGTWVSESGATTWGIVATPPPPARPTMVGEASSGILDPMVAAGSVASCGARTSPWESPAWM